MARRNLLTTLSNVTLADDKEDFIDIGRWGVFCPRLKKGARGRLLHPNEVTYFHSVKSGDATDFRRNPEIKLKEMLETMAPTRGSQAKLFLDENRKEMVAEVAQKALLLDKSPSNLTQNSHHRICIGMKGSGKSTFFQAIVISLQPLLHNVITIWCDLNTLDLSVYKSPLCILKEALVKIIPEGMNLPIELCQLVDSENADVSRFLSITAQLGIRFMLFIDEYTSIYQQVSTIADPYIKQMYTIGNIGSSNILVYLGGSSPYMRSLLYGKLDKTAEVASKFPSYPGLRCNLNIQRFQEIVLQPIRQKSDFEQCIVGIDARLRVKHAPVMYMLTGGRYRLLDQAIEQLKNESSTSSRYSQFYKVKALCDSYGDIYKGMLDVLVKRSETDAHYLKNLWNLTSDIPWSLVAIKCPSVTISNLYDMADNHGIYLSQTLGVDIIAFPSPLLPLFLLEHQHDGDKLPTWFSSRLRICLKFPNSILGIEAEEVLKRSIFCGLSDNRSMESILKGEYTCDEKHMDEFQAHTISVKFSSERASLKTDTKELPIRRVSSVSVGPNSLNQFFKTQQFLVADEIPDKCGSDITVLIPSTCSYRLQLKLGSSRLGLTIARKIIRKLKAGVDKWASIWKHPTQMGLLTTRPITAGAIKLFQEENVFVMDKTKLRALWPMSVATWAEEQSLEQYMRASARNVTDGFEGVDEEENGDEEDDGVDVISDETESEDEED